MVDGSLVASIRNIIFYCIINEHYRNDQNGKLTNDEFYKQKCWTVKCNINVHIFLVWNTVWCVEIIFIVVYIVYYPLQMICVYSANTHWYITDLYAIWSLSLRNIIFDIKSHMIEPLTIVLRTKIFFLSPIYMNYINYLIWYVHHTLLFSQ